MNSQKKYLIVGANSPLSILLISKLPASQTYVIYNSEPNFKIEHVSYLSTGELDKLRNIDVVFIISAYIPDTIHSFDATNLLFQVNVILVEKVTKQFKGAKFIYASSVSVFDISKNTITEDASVFPNSPYAISKFWAEQIVKQTANYSIFRISSMLGEGMKHKTFIPKIIDNAISSGVITLYGSGQRMQNYINYKDVCQMMIFAASINVNETYLAVHPLSYTNKYIAEIIRHSLTNISIQYVGEDTEPSYIYDATKTYRTLNYSPKITIEESIQEIIAWKKKLF